VLDYRGSIPGGEERFLFSPQSPDLLWDWYCDTDKDKNHIPDEERKLVIKRNIYCNSYCFFFFLSLWLYSPSDFGRFFSFFIYTQPVGLLKRGIGPSQGRSLHTEQHEQNKHIQTSMPWVGFERTVQVVERGSLTARPSFLLLHKSTANFSNKQETSLTTCSINRERSAFLCTLICDLFEDAFSSSEYTVQY
jgi:hypothetical protein